MNRRKNKFLFWILWTLSIGFPWFIFVFPGLKIRNLNIISWYEIWQILGRLLFPCFMIGLLVSVAQYLLLKNQLNFSRAWIIYSILGYTFVPPITMCMIITIFGLVYPETLSTRGIHFLSVPLDLTMIFSGLLVGIIQLPAFPKKDIENTGKSIPWLWVLGSSLAWGLGFLVSSFRYDSLRFESMLSGLTIGMITGGVFILIDYQANKMMDDSQQKEV